MYHKYAVYTIALITLSLATACQQEAEQEKAPHLFAELYVRYLEAERALKATATFFEGDTIQTANPKTLPDGVAFLGSGMEARPLPGGTTRYTYEQNADYAPAFPFRFKDNDGQQQEFQLSMAPVDTFYIVDGIASKAEGMSLITRGGQLQAGESLVLLFNDARNQAYSVTLAGPSLGAEFRIPAQQLEGLKPGPHQLYLVKKKQSIEQKSNISVRADVEFYTGVVAVEVAE